MTLEEAKRFYFDYLGLSFHMDSLEPDALARVIENMEGRTESGKDGGIYLFRSYPELAARLEDIMKRLASAL